MSHDLVRGDLLVGTQEERDDRRYLPSSDCEPESGALCLLSDRLTDVVTVRVEDAVQVVTLVMASSAPERIASGHDLAG